MASRSRKPGSSGSSGPSGRVTPKGGAPRPAAGKAARPAPTARGAPFDPDKPVAVGRRPSSAGFLAFVAVMWMAVGIIMFLTLSTGWRLIPAIVAFGIGVLFLRGSISTVVRRENRRSSGG